jgi:tRNA A-37 threonylcarbamoyl transferase component Bud32
MKNHEIIAQGAEAIITLEKNKVLKNRISKSYRHPELDKKIRKRRTKSEYKLLLKASKLIPIPTISPNNKDFQISMQYIKGKKLSEHLESLDFKSICNEIGSSLAILHDAGIIHGDLTTSNMILSNSPASANLKLISSPQPASPPHSNTSGLNINNSSKVFFIDFGLGFHSNRIEDKAVDLHLIKQALEAKHPTIYKEAFSSILKGYKKSENYEKTIKQLEKVEKRGRYKEQY